MKKFKLHYYVSNNGDGSASVQFQENAETAEKEDEGQSEGWGESSASYEEIILKDGKLYFEKSDYVGKKWVKKLVPLEELPD